MVVCSDDGGKVQLNNQRDAASRHGSICSYRTVSPPHQSFSSFHPSASASRRASSVSRYSAAADVTGGSCDSRKPSIACVVPSRQNSVSALGGGGGGGGGLGCRAQTSVGSASLDEYQHNGPPSAPAAAERDRRTASTSTMTWSVTENIARRTGSASG